MNSVSISGRLTRDPEMRRTNSGKAVLTFAVAVPRPNVKDQVDFIECVAWEQRAEFINQYFKKGNRIEVGGALTTRNYEKDGKNHKVMEVRADFVSFGESKKRENDDGYGDSYSNDNNNYGYSRSEEDLPF